MTQHIVIVGGGPAGYVAALHAHDHGAEVTLVGGDDLGGTCVWRGCIPTKALIASGKLLVQMGHGGHFGLVGGAHVAADWAGMRTRALQIAQNSAKGITALLDQRGVRRIPGRARFLAADTLATDAGELHADRILLTTGSRPLVPRAFETDGVLVGTSDDVLRWETLPASVLIVGGGVIACEFAFLLNALGVAVTVLERLDSPLPGEEPEVRRVLLREMKKRGIRFVGGTAIERLDVRAGRVECQAQGRKIQQADRVVIAVGRTPNTAGLGLDRTGIDTAPDGAIPVDRHQRTRVPGIYAAGDVTGGLMLAHNASFQGRVAINHMLGRAGDSAEGHRIPRVTFTDPEVASVGLGEQAARELRGDAVAVGTFDLRGLGMAHATGALAGLVKVVIDAPTREVLGVHIVGAHAAEMINEASVVVNNAIPADRLVHTVHAHPTLSEAIVEAAEAALRGHSTHQPAARGREKEEKVDVGRFVSLS